MSTPVNLHDTKMQFSKLVARAQAGHEFVITRAGKPVAKLVPFAFKARPRKLGALKGSLKTPDDFDAPMQPEAIAIFDGG
jgi:prevent-host-death family protein